MTKFKIFPLRTGSISKKHDVNHPWVKGVLNDEKRCLEVLIRN